MTRTPFREKPIAQAEWLASQVQSIQYQAGHDRVVGIGHLNVSIHDRSVTEAHAAPLARIRPVGTVPTVLRD